MFIVQESMSMSDKYMIGVTTEIFKHFDKITFHPSVLAARLYGLEYDEYLRYLRDEKGAMLIGKKCRWITAYFHSKDNCESIVKELNRRWSVWLESSVS